MDYEVVLLIVAAFLGCHLTNVTRALRKKSGETISKLANSDTQYKPQMRIGWLRGEITRRAPIMYYGGNHS